VPNRKSAALATLLVLGLGAATVPKADAAFTLYLYESGADVVGTGSGSLDLDGLTFVIQTTTGFSAIVSSAAFIDVGAGTSLDVYDTISGPKSLGLVPHISASSFVGGLVGVNGDQADLLVPGGYVSGTSLSSSSTWDGKTLAALGVTPGIYTWTWGSAATADSFTLDIGDAPPSDVPEPMSGALLLGALGVLGLARRSRG
jgi:hypothetical protein